jgi:hypothetical protein
MEEDALDVALVHSLCAQLARDIRQRARWSDFIIVGVATPGSFYVAWRLGELLQAYSVMGLPIHYDANDVPGIDHTITLNPEPVRNTCVVGVDAILTPASGKLHTDLRAIVTRMEGEYLPVSLIGVGSYPRLRDLIVAVAYATRPRCFWEENMDD